VSRFLVGYLAGFSSAVAVGAACAYKLWGTQGFIDKVEEEKRNQGL